MNRLNKLLSYFYPITIETTSSELNPLLEVVFQDGRYMLNSANANYSYGGLYDLFKLIFKQIPIDWKNISDVLILGFGAGCTVPLIRQYSTTCKIVGVEVDDKVFELGKKYFNIDSFENTSIICDTASNYVTNTNQKFDLVIIDVYVDLDVPNEVESIEFLEKLKLTLNQNGIVIFNKLTPTKSYRKQIPELSNLYKEVFGNIELHRIMETGSIFVSKNI